MPQDLSQVKEVFAAISAVYVNQKLRSGEWVLLEMKIVESADWDKHHQYVYKTHNTIYVIGRIK
ncbi:MAG: hypothetical protein U9P90_03555 [Patescibacteria group bacterium]|nr:hypothetical protein [Patescibacteria group bacterium]